MMIDEVNHIIREALTSLGYKIPDNFSVEASTNNNHGDYASNVAMILAKDLTQNPQEIAQSIVAKITSTSTFEKVEVAATGFINFWLSKAALMQNLADNSSLASKKYLVEFAQPNTHKEFHIGHLRGIITGESICRILEKSGAKITRGNYQGDVGMHIAKAMWGINKLGTTESEDLLDRIKFLGTAYVEGNKAYEEGEAKSEIEEINKKIYEKSDPKLLDLYQQTRSWSLEYFQSIYDRLSVKFDRLYFESEVAELGKKIALDALNKTILVKSQGAIIFPGSQFGLHDRVFISSQGTPTYEAKDIGLALLQFKEYNPDKIFHVVGPEQTGYFQVLFAALAKIMPESKNREKHIAYGWVRLKEGKMSSRQGNVVTGLWLLEQVKNKIIEKYKLPPEVAEQIMIGAVKYSFLKVNLASEIAFDIDESISIEGNSGPYIQYTVARIFGLFRKAGIYVKSIDQNSQKTADLEDKEKQILRKLIHYPEIVYKSAQSIAPHYICEYLYQLAETYNSYYGSVRILSDEKNKNSRLALSLSVAKVLKNGLDLLGIPSPERL